MLFDHALLGLGVGIAVLMLLLGPWAGLVAAFVHVNLYLATSAAVNAMAHHFGRRPDDEVLGDEPAVARLAHRR